MLLHHLHNPIPMLKAKIPFYYLLLGIAVTFVTFFILSNTTIKNNKKASATSAPATTSNCTIDRKRLEGFSYIRPVIYAEQECESPELNPVKENVINTINLAKNEGLITSASVYIRVFSKAYWTGIDQDEKYHPASLNKVPILMTYLRMVEGNNSILNQTILFAKQDTSLPHETFTSKNIVPGHSYTVKDLLHYMIAYSDNNATLLLMQHMNLDIYNKLFADLGLAKPSFNYEEFQLSVKEYSLFMRVLYGATYLSMPASEYAMEILADCDFKEGMMKQLPTDIKVAHKFGESGYGDTYELHESGVVYIGDKSYLITVMTKGHDLKKQATVISNISAQVYSSMVSSAI